MADSPPLLLEARGIQKHFGRVVALRDGNFGLRPSEVHAIVGDNGAGKSTLIKIISGVYSADGGDLLLDGDKVTIGNPREARTFGIETVYQDLALADDLDAAANLFLGREELRPPPLSWFGFLDRKTMRLRAEEAMKRLRIDIPSVETPVLSLSGGQRQAVAVARAIAWGTRIVIMDEPTAALGVRESGQVLELIKEVRCPGAGRDHDQPQPSRGVHGRRPDHRAAARPDDHDPRDREDEPRGDRRDDDRGRGGRRVGGRGG